MKLTSTVATIALLCVGSTARAQRIPVGAKYVAMGSSYAAGPKVGTPADSASDRCARSRDNYAHQLARQRHLALTDVSCGGATTAHVLGPWLELPAQLDAVDGATWLVTVTIGGNDVNYMSVLSAGACKGAPSGRTCRAAPIVPSDSAYAALEARLTVIAQTVKTRAPKARMVFVQHFSVPPCAGTCAVLTMSAADADAARTMARRLAEATVAAAKNGGAELLPLNDLSASHNACSSTPWINGDLAATPPSDGTSFHPRLSGMTAVAEALDHLLGASADGRKPR